MLHDGRAIRVAVIGGARIPFCRSHSAYRGCSNQDLMVGALNGLVDKFPGRNYPFLKNRQISIGALANYDLWLLAKNGVNLA